jgi:hypothetical protein
MGRIPEFNFKGIKRITIPKRDSDFSPSNNYGWEIIKKYLPNILSAHKENARKIQDSFKRRPCDSAAREKRHGFERNKNPQKLLSASFKERIRSLCDSF